MSLKHISVLVLAAVALGAVPAWAQTSGRADLAVGAPVDQQGPASSAARPSTSAPRKIGVRAFVAIDSDALAAKQTFKAVLGTSQLTAFGAGADVLNVWHRAFVRFAITHVAKDGNRGFVFNSQFFSLGIPTTITMTPIEFGGGWQFAPLGSAAHAVTPYAGVTFVRLGYSDVSSGVGADPSTDVSTSFSGVGVFGGAEFVVWHPVIVNVEAQYRNLSNSFGSGGISQQFSENNAGGAAVRVMFGVKF